MPSPASSCIPTTLRAGRSCSCSTSRSERVVTSDALRLCDAVAGSTISGAGAGAGSGVGDSGGELIVAQLVGVPLIGGRIE
jgi:hypothetical protein